MIHKKITLDEARQILIRPESHFWDFKSKQIKGAKLQKSVVAFANADSGEILVGIEDSSVGPADELQRWIGFEKIEEANQLIQTIAQDIAPPPPVDFEFMEIEGQPSKGHVLRILVGKSTEVHKTSANEYYVRKSAQNLPMTVDDIHNLKLSKGLISYEDQLVST